MVRLPAGDCTFFTKSYNLEINISTNLASEKYSGYNEIKYTAGNGRQMCIVSLLMGVYAPQEMQY